MTRTVLTLLVSLLAAAGAFVPTASASAGPCDYAPSVCDAIAMVLRLCDQLVAGGCEVAIDDPVPEWLEESVNHLCDHWLDGCEIQNRSYALLP